MVIVIPEAEIIDENGIETDEMGCRYINEHLGLDGVWIQASYNGRIRGIYPGIGFTYDPVTDVFIPPGWNVRMSRIVTSNDPEETQP